MSSENLTWTRFYLKRHMNDIRWHTELKGPPFINTLLVSGEILFLGHKSGTFVWRVYLYMFC